VNVAVVVTELSLASARDTIRVLAWLKQNAPHCKSLVVANNVQAATLEISRKDFEGTIERKIDLLLPSDPKSTAQAAKLGQPIVEAVRASKVSTGLLTLAEMIAGTAVEAVEAAPTEAKPKKSVMSGFKALMSKK
jgi:pilus assembly protein CpaE